MTDQPVESAPLLRPHDEGPSAARSDSHSMTRERTAARTRALRIALVVLLAAILSCVFENVLIDLFLPHFARLTSDFSPAYLQREMRFLAAAPPRTLVLGDSVTWGYRITPRQTVVAVLAQDGCACENLSLKNGSPPNYYALVRIALAAGVRPRQAIVEINQKAFNAADPGFLVLHPALAQLAVPYLSAAERTELGLTPTSAAYPSALTRALDRLSSLYAMRTDIREAVYGDVDNAPLQRITPDMLEGTYDLSPLTEKNAGVRYLEQAVAALHAAGVPVLAYLTPTNHQLLHEYIDVPAYRANAAFLRAAVERRGARVLDFDRALPPNEFIDEAHLTPQGQRHLAALLRPYVTGAGPAAPASQGS